MSDGRLLRAGVSLAVLVGCAVFAASPTTGAPGVEPAALAQPLPVRFFQPGGRVPAPRQGARRIDDRGPSFRMAPMLPDGPFIPVAQDSPETSLSTEAPRPGRLGKLAATDPVVIGQSREVTNIPNGFASTTHEPSVAVNGNTVVMTGNWWAAYSTNGGSTWTQMDPFAALPANVDGGFCCDQVVQYIPSIDRFVWLLQGIEGGNGENRYRLMMASTAQVASNSWSFVDVTSAMLSFTGQNMDFPDVSIGTNSLYLNFNVYNSAGFWQKSSVVRIPLASLAAGSTANTFFFSVTSNFNLRVVQNLGTTGYFVTHETNSSLKIYSWVEGTTTVNSNIVNHATFSTADYSSITPSGQDWLGFADQRITGATKSGTDIWVAWQAGRGGAGNRPHPYVEVVKINSTNMTLISQPVIFNNGYAFAYPGLATNGNGEVGMSVAYGGASSLHPASAVGMLTGTSGFIATTSGAASPSQPRWGDYLTCRPQPTATGHFAATGYSLKTGGATQPIPVYVLFGRSGDFGGGGGGVAAPSGLGAVPLNSNSIQLTWTDNATDEVGFKVEMKMQGGAYQEVGGLNLGANANTVTINGLSAGTTYFFQVRAYNNSENSGYSNEAQARTQDGLPNPPSNLTAAAKTRTKIGIKWTDNSPNESVFVVEMKAPGSTFMEIGTVPADTVAANVSGLRRNTKYSFRIRARNGSGTSDPSNTAKAKTKS